MWRLALPLVFAAIFSTPAQDRVPYQGTPFHDSHHSGIQKLPGRVECALYDLGGEGVAYHDSDAKNLGSGGLNPADGTYLNQFRMDEGVDTSYTKFHDQIDNNPFNRILPDPQHPSARRTQPHPRPYPSLPETRAQPAARAAPGQARPSAPTY